MGLAPDKPTILLMAGSFGVKTIVQIYRDIIHCANGFSNDCDYRKNQRLYQKH